MAAEGWSAPISHTVAPTVWAWGRRRRRVARAVDGLLCLFLEPDYFTPLGVKARFIGHPEAFNLAYDKASRPPSSDTPHVTLLPEAAAPRSIIISPMLITLDNLHYTHPQVTATILALPSMRSEIELVMQRMPERGRRDRRLWRQRAL